jgi:hypothetical protein
MLSLRAKELHSTLLRFSRDLISLISNYDSPPEVTLKLMRELRVVTYPVGVQLNNERKIDKGFTYDSGANFGKERWGIVKTTKTTVEELLQWGEDPSLAYSIDVRLKGVKSRKRKLQNKSVVVTDLI